MSTQTLCPAEMEPAGASEWPYGDASTVPGARVPVRERSCQTRIGVLAACNAEEIERLFDLIRQDHFVASIFCQLADEPASGTCVPPDCAFDVADLLRHTGLSRSGQLMDCCRAIDRALQRLRDDREATLFRFTPTNDLLIDRTTLRSIRGLRTKPHRRG